MRLTILAAIAGLLIASVATASGLRPPAHSNLSYSFTCPTGASGHLSYVIDFATDFSPKLTIWVNGRYIHEDQEVTEAIRGHNVQQLLASCGEDQTRIWLRTYNPGDVDTGIVTIDVDRAGVVLAAQYGP